MWRGNDMRIALGISYDGTHYFGWQRQEDLQLPTIQTCLEEAITKVADHKIDVVCAGRTDRGVHALGQVLHFDTHAMRNDNAWILGVNSYLPKDIRVQWMCVVDEDFHARFSAQSRRYRYVIYNHPIKPALLRHQVTTHYHPLNEQDMQTAANYLIGEHDFTSYRAVQCQAKSPIRTVTMLNVQRRGNFIAIDIQANAFLHHMVRNITGVLLTIGEGKRAPLWAKEVLEAKNRREGDITAPASGLYFVEVSYPEKFLLPQKSEPSWWGL